VLLDAAQRTIRPAILWNDGRSAAACRELERREPRSRAITGNLAMPGFTAPKLVWLAAHEPANFARTAHVLLPKDWLRLRLTGELVSEPSDAAGTLWLDVAERRWSDEMLGACGLHARHMPSLSESCEPTAELLPEVAAAWGLGRHVLVAAGASDNAAGAIGLFQRAHAAWLIDRGPPGSVPVSPAEWTHLTSVGRLDNDSEGLIFMTNDGEFALRLSHPRYGIRKTYHLTVEGKMEDAVVRRFTSGVEEGGERLKALGCRVMSTNNTRTILEVVLGEGRNRELRRICSALGLNALRVHRVQIGPIKLGELRSGKWRALTETEIKSLLGPV